MTIALRPRIFTKITVLTCPHAARNRCSSVRLCTYPFRMSAPVIGYQNIRGFLDFVYKLICKHLLGFAVSLYFDEA